MENEKELTFKDALACGKDSFKEFRKKIKKANFDFDTPDDAGKTLLITFTENNPSSNTDQLWVLLDYLADPNIKDNDGKTALHYAYKGNKKEMILALLLFGASTELADNEGKKPFDPSVNNKEVMTPFIEKVNSVKQHFISLTRKRRKFLKLIFDEIDLSTKAIDENKLGSFYEKINNETPDEAVKDAQVFITAAKIIKNDFEQKSSICFEEFVIAISRIAQLHGMKPVDDLITLFKAVREKEKEVAS